MAKKLILLLITLAILTLPASGKDMAFLTRGSDHELVVDLDRYFISIYSYVDYQPLLETKQYLFSGGLKRELSFLTAHAGLAVIEDQITTYWFEDTNGDGKPEKLSSGPRENYRLRPLLGVSATKSIGKSTLTVDYFCVGESTKCGAMYKRQISDVSLAVSYIYSPDLEIGAVRVGFSAPL